MIEKGSILSVSERTFGVVTDHGFTLFARFTLALDHCYLL